MSGSISPRSVILRAALLMAVCTAAVTGAAAGEPLPRLALSPTGGDAAPGLLESLRSPAAFSLFDTKRLTVDHALAFGVATNGKKTVTSSLYANTLTYRISEPLTLRLRWGLSGAPSSTVSRFGSDGPVQVLPPAFELRYRPSEHFMVRVQYASASATASSSVLPYRFAD